MTLIADFATLTKPNGQCFELFNRERAGWYARNLGIKGVALPTATDIAELCLLPEYSTPLDDNMFWANQDDPLSSMVTGLIPMGIVGLDGNTISQIVKETASGRSVIAERRHESRSITMRFAIVGATCCAVDRFKRRMNSWIGQCLDCDGMEMRLLTCAPGVIDDCDGDPVQYDAEWTTVCGLALTSGLRSTGQIDSGAGCQACGGSRVEVVSLTFTATDPWLYDDPICLGDCTFDAESSAVCNIVPFLEQLCCPEVEVEVEVDKERKPIELKLDGTACPIGWAVEDYDPERCYLWPGVFETPAVVECKPYRVRLRIYEDLSTEWAKINPDRWPDDGSIPCDCDIIVADLEYPNPDHQPNCPECPGGEGTPEQCADQHNIVLDDAGVIDFDATFPGVTLPLVKTSAEFAQLIAYYDCAGFGYPQEQHEDVQPPGNDETQQFDTLFVDIDPDTGEAAWCLETYDLVWPAGGTPSTEECTVIPEPDLDGAFDDDGNPLPEDEWTGQVGCAADAGINIIVSGGTANVQLLNQFGPGPHGPSSGAWTALSAYADCIGFSFPGGGDAVTIKVDPANPGMLSVCVTTFGEPPIGSPTVENQVTTYTPFESEPATGTCGDTLAAHCEPTLLYTQNALPNQATQECFNINLIEDGTFTHDGWDFDRDGIPPTFGAIGVDNCAVVTDDSGCAPGERECVVVVTVDTDAGTMAWDTDGTWDFDPAVGLPAECTVVLQGQEPGTYPDVELVPDPTCNSCGSVDTSGCLDAGCNQPTVPDIPDSGAGCAQCAMPLVEAATCKRAPAPGLGREAVPRIVICSGSEPLGQFSMRVTTDPLGSLTQWDFTADPPVQILDGDGEPILVDNVVECIDDCDVCAGFRVAGMPAGAVLEIDPKTREATMVCEGGVVDATSLLSGLGDAPFDWSSLELKGCDDFVLCASADALAVGFDGIAEVPASWTVYWAVRDSG